MKMKKLLGVFFAVNLLAGISSATANTIWLEPASLSTGPGSVITLTLHMDFTDTTIGGGVDLFYDDSVLDFVSFVFNPPFDWCSYCLPPDDLPGEVNGIWIHDPLGAVISGHHIIGTFTFNTLTPGSTALWMADNDFPVGPFWDMSRSYVLPVNYAGAEVLVTPLPAAAWLMFAGLSLLVGFGRRKLRVST